MRCLAPAAQTGDEAVAAATGATGAQAFAVTPAAAVTPAFAVTLAVAVTPAAASLAEVVADWKASRAALGAAAQAFPDDWLAGGNAGPLQGLRAAVGRYQTAAAAVNGQAQAAARAPGPHFFLGHAAFAGQPHRAVAAWAAHAAAQGVPPARLPQRLARSGGARFASPRLLSAAYGHFLASAVTRVGLALFRHFANEP
jgi:hypothetical protein